VKPQHAAVRTPGIPDGDDAPEVPLGRFRENVAGFLLNPIEAALVCAHVPIMRACAPVKLSSTT
jgi:hypothetical protein